MKKSASVKSSYLNPQFNIVFFQLNPVSKNLQISFLNVLLHGKRFTQPVNVLSINYKNHQIMMQLIFEATTPSLKQQLSIKINLLKSRIQKILTFQIYLNLKKEPIKAISCKILTYNSILILLQFIIMKINFIIKNFLIQLILYLMILSMMNQMKYQ